MENFNQNNIKYLEAAKRVKRLKGFYIHAVVYFLVNVFIVIQNVKSGASLSNMVITGRLSFGVSDFWVMVSAFFYRI